jgi:hypothetical protein
LRLYPTLEFSDLTILQKIMSIKHSIVNLFAMASLASGLPNAASGLDLHKVDDKRDGQSFVDPLAARGLNQCSPTGPESCNFYLSIAKIGSSLDPKISRSWHVYDNGCHDIGGGTLLYLKSASLRSQLPYTIELNVDGAPWSLSGGFWYAGRYTDLGGAYCEDCSGQYLTTCCRIAFRCH